MNGDCIAARKRGVVRKGEREDTCRAEKREIRWFISRSQWMSPRFIDVGPLSNSPFLWNSRARSKARTLNFELCFTNFFAPLERMSPDSATCSGSWWALRFVFVFSCKVGKRKWLLITLLIKSETYSFNIELFYYQICVSHAYKASTFGNTLEIIIISDISYEK